MKRLISIIFTLLVVFTLNACKAEMSIQEYKEIENKIESELREELQAEFDRELQKAKDDLEPIIIHKEGKEIIEKEVIVEVPIPMTEAEIQKIKDDLKKESDIALQYAIDHLQPEIKEVEKIVYQDRDVPIDGEKYEFGFDVCVTFTESGDNLFHVNGTVRNKLSGALFGDNYEIELEDANASGVASYSFKNEAAYTVCYRMFGDKPDGFDSDWPKFIPTEAPVKKDDE